MFGFGWIGASAYSGIGVRLAWIGVRLAAESVFGLRRNTHIVGTITREDKFGEPTELRPKIIFTDLVPVEDATAPVADQQPLFFDEEA